MQGRENNIQQGDTKMSYQAWPDDDTNVTFIFFSFRKEYNYGCEI